MAKRIEGMTPKQDGFRMPAEFEGQTQIWMLWPERTDNWRNGTKPAQKVCEIETKRKEYLNLEKGIWVKDESTQKGRTDILKTRAIRSIRRRRWHTSSFARRPMPGDAN